MNSVEIPIVCNRVNIGQSKKTNLYTHMTFSSGVTGSVTLIIFSSNTIVLKLHKPGKNEECRAVSTWSNYF